MKAYLCFLYGSHTSNYITVTPRNTTSYNTKHPQTNHPNELVIQAPGNRWYVDTA